MPSASNGKLAEVLLSCHQPSDNAGAKASDRTCYRTCRGLSSPGDGERCWEDGAADQQAHDEEEPAEIYADCIPDDGEETHGQAEDANADFAHEDQTAGRCFGVEVGLVDVEGEDR